MNVLTRSDRSARKLCTAIGDYFVRVCVRARARAGLKNVERKMLIEFSLNYFFGRLRDQRRALGIEQPEIVISLCSRQFDQAQRANEWPRKTVTAHRKIQHGAVRGSAMQRGC